MGTQNAVTVQFGFKTSAGLVRENNEDSYFTIPDENVYIVADGVGGARSGDLASQTAVECIAGYIRKSNISSFSTDDEIQKCFRECIEAANREVYMLAFSGEENLGMATTAVMVHIRDGAAYFANVGDSRAYIFKCGELHQITEDHTYVNTLVKRGEISEEDAKNHMQRNIITRALGADKNVVPDIYKEEVGKGDIILLCTDGFYGDVSESEIRKILERDQTMHDTCQMLVESAFKGGGHDNITVICLKI